MTMMTATSSSFKKQRTLVILIALCIHGGLGTLLFLLEPIHDSLYSQEAQIILLDEQQLNEQRLNKQQIIEQKNRTSLVTTPPEEWGEMLGRHNIFGLPDGEVAITTISPLPTDAPHNMPQPTLQQTIDNQLNNTLSADATHKAMSVEEAVSENLSALADVSPENQNTAQNTDQSTLSQNTKNSEAKNPEHGPSLETPSKHSPSALTLAAIGRGFIEQAKYDGTHNVTMLGKKGGAISAEQLKIERYVERLSWCLQNSFKVLRNSIEPHISSEAEVQIYLQLDRSGTIQELRLLKGSGSSTLDNHTLAVFKDAGSSFPPVPTYIKASPFAIAFHVDYGIAHNTAPLSFSFSH